MVGYGGGVTLPWDTFQLSKKAAASPFPTSLAKSAGVLPYYIHPHDDPERDEPCRTDNTHRQTDMVKYATGRKLHTYIHGDTYA